MTSQIKKAFEAGMIEGNCGECGALKQIRRNLAGFPWCIYVLTDTRNLAEDKKFVFVFAFFHDRLGYALLTDD